MTQVRFNLDEYSIRVLDIIKGKFSLKNRNDALKKFIDVYGENFLEKENSKYIETHFDNILKEHYEKYKGNKNKMSLDDVDKLLGLK